MTRRKRKTVTWKFVHIGFGQPGAVVQKHAMAEHVTDLPANVLQGSPQNVPQSKQIAKRKTARLMLVQIGFGANGKNVPWIADLEPSPALQPAVIRVNNTINNSPADFF